MALDSRSCFWIKSASWIRFWSEMMKSMKGGIQRFRRRENTGVHVELGFLVLEIGIMKVGLISAMVIVDWGMETGC